ncbi:MAG: FecR family protein [Bacteroidia bacterium]|nr:FecR family protein [Bacteroidia bacterium]
MSPELEHKIIQYLTNCMSSEDRALFVQEMDANVLLRKEFDVYKSIWEVTNSLSYESESVNHSWKGFEPKITDKPHYFLSKSSFVNVAASIIIIAILTIVTWNFISKESNFETSQYAKDYVLDDNSQVILNPNSKLILPNDFNSSNREVTLLGEAYFDVVESNKKFIVHTTIGDVIVHGTQFKVSVNEDDQSVSVELFDGILSYIQSNQEYRLKSGDLLISSSNEITKTTSNISMTNDGYVICKNTSLANILAQIDLIYDVNHYIKPRLLKGVYSVSLPKNDLKNCIKILNQISGNNFALIDNSIVLK